MTDDVAGVEQGVVGELVEETGRHVTQHSEVKSAGTRFADAAGEQRIALAVTMPIPSAPGLAGCLRVRRVGQAT
jgi:hypothetical protein